MSVRKPVVLFFPSYYSDEAAPPLAKTMAYRPPIQETRYPNELPPAEAPVPEPQACASAPNAPQQPYAGAQNTGHQAQPAMAPLAGFAAAGAAAVGEDERGRLARLA